MRTSKLDFSPREQRLVEELVEEVCGVMGLPVCDEELHQCAWAAFLEYYRKNPVDACCFRLQEWVQIYLVLREALEREKKSMNERRYRQCSLDQPMGEENPTPSVERIRSVQGDFQNSICLFDYLQRLGKDPCRVARDLIRGWEISEIQSHYSWSDAHMRRVWSRLEQGMEAYLSL